MDAERQLIISALNTKDTRLYFHKECVTFKKSKNLSSHARKKAIENYDTKKHNFKGHTYMLSANALAVSCAPLGSEELALAYHQRALFFHHLAKYEEALNDIEHAIWITKSNCLKVKLYCIQASCYAELERPEQRAAFVKAKFMYNKLNDNEKDKTELKGLIDNLEDMIDYGNPEYLRSVKKKKGMDVEDVLSRKEAENPFKSLSIRDNEKDGRHLVAARNIKAGEIISVSKPYAMNSNPIAQHHLFCCHCMKITWDCVPCNVCGWSVFCSEKCRDEAWEQYHDMECAVVPMIRCTAEHQHLRQLTVRTVITAVRQAGGISELRKEIQEVDKCSDMKNKGLSKNGRFENDKFISIYSLMSRKSTSLAKIDVKDAVKILIAFVKNTKLFGNADKFKVASELSADEDVIFIGSLILRLFEIFNVNHQDVWEKNAACKNKRDKKVCFEKKVCCRASMISSLFSLINHSCNPNAALLYTDANKLMLVALKPIKKNDQIYHAYSGCGLYFEEKKEDRQWKCRTAYNFTCECEACLNDWPLLEKIDKPKEQLLPDIQKSYELFGEKLKKINDLVTSIEENQIRYDEATLKELANAIELATRNYLEPSYTISKLVRALSTGYRKLYLKRLRFPHYCDYR